MSEVQTSESMYTTSRDSPSLVRSRAGDEQGRRRRVAHGSGCSSSSASAAETKLKVMMRNEACRKPGGEGDTAYIFYIKLNLVQLTMVLLIDEPKLAWRCYFFPRPRGSHMLSATTQTHVALCKSRNQSWLYGEFERVKASRFRAITMQILL